MRCYGRGLRLAASLLCAWVVLVNVSAAVDGPSGASDQGSEQGSEKNMPTCSSAPCMDDIAAVLEAEHYHVDEKPTPTPCGVGRPRSQQVRYRLRCFGRSAGSPGGDGSLVHAAAVFADNILSFSGCMMYRHHTPRQKVAVSHAWNRLHRTSVAVMNDDGAYCLEWSVVVLNDDDEETVKRHVAFAAREFDRQWCAFRFEVERYRVESSEEEWVEGYVVLGAGLDHANGVYLPHSYSDGVRYDPPSSAHNPRTVLSHVRTTSHRSFKRAGSKNGTLFRWRPAGAMGSAW